MIALDALAEIAAAVGGTLRDADPDTVVTGAVEYDSRKVGPGGLFVAVPGEHVDGHDFAAGRGRRRARSPCCARAAVAAPRIEVADGDRGADRAGRRRSPAG